MFTTLGEEVFFNSCRVGTVSGVPPPSRDDIDEALMAWMTVHRLGDLAEVYFSVCAGDLNCFLRG